MLKPLVLARRLELWVDVANIRVGDEWHPEIAAAITRSRVALVLVSSRLLASEYIMGHELPELIGNGVTLAPVLVGDCLWDHVPELARIQWLHDPVREGALSRHADGVGPRDRAVTRICQRLVAFLPEPAGYTNRPSDPLPASAPGIATRAAGGLGALSRVPDLPPGYVERAELAELVDVVLGRASSAAGVVGRPAPVGLHGQGGIGKTVLAAAVARRNDVRHRFSDGVLWIVLGERPDLLAVQIDLLSRLGRTGPPPRTTTNARAELARVLADRRVLLVVDDVWSTVPPWRSG